jgi:transposase
LPERCLLIGGERHYISQVEVLIAGLSADQVIADTAYDADYFRAGTAQTGATAVIPCNLSRTGKLPLDKDRYKQRHLVEYCINKLKHFRRIATRYEKTTRNFLAMITVVAILLWLR